MGSAMVCAAAGLASGQSLTTTFVSGNQFAGNMFDLKNLTAGDLTVDELDVNMTLPGTLQNVGVWYRLDSFTNSPGSQTGWIDAGTYSVTSAGQDLPTKVTLTTGITIPAGATYGMYVFLTDYITNPAPPGVANWRYTNIPPALPQYANSDLQLDGGVGKGSPPFTGSTFANRMWNGTVYYTLGGGCYADCDGNGTLNVFDYICFGNAYSSSQAYADCDGNGSFNVFDYICFGNAYSAGCP